MGTRRRRSAVVAAAAAIACSAVAALGAAFSWTGNGADDKYKTCNNWAATGVPQECYPSSTSDDAKFPFTQGGWGTVELDFSSMAIDDLSVLASVTLTDDAPTGSTLTVNSLVIDASDGDVTLSVTGEAILKTPSP